MPSPADLTLCDAADAVARRKISALDLTRSCLDRLETEGRALNAVIWLDRTVALARAESADRAAQASRDPLPPLHGVPLAHKDLFYSAGQPCTCGSAIRADFRPDFTATVVARLEAAGAITIGGLAMAEFAQGPTGHNRHFGDCRNPWNRARISGGSSSGSGAAVAARLVPGSLGSDTGGSIRLPASCCGVTGLKPTQGRVSRHGVMPLAFSADCIGPIARTARDCARLLAVIAGHDPLDAASSAAPVPPYESRLDGDIRGLRIGIPLTWFFDGVEESIRRRFDDAVAVLEARGAMVTHLPLPVMDEVAACSAVVSRVELAAIHARWMRERPGDYAANVSGRMYPGYAIPGVAYVEALRRRGPVLEAFAREVFAKVDVLATPTIRAPIPTLAETDVESGDEGAVRRFLAPSANTRPINYLGLPAISLPCGFDDNALPVGLQIIGRPFAEARLLRIGEAYQRDTDFHRLAPPGDPHD